MASGQQPQQFGKYTLVEKIAVGGMAEIYRAKTFGAAGFEKDLVIKRILSQFSNDEEFVRMFIDEARLAAKLQHANVVQIFDFDGVEAPPGEISYYIAMEWVDGKDLRHLLKEGARRRDPLSAAAAVHVAVETLKGLHYAHTRSEGGRPLGIVHRDVSPHNVLVSYSGDVKISDFGIAKAAARAAVTTNGMVKGKIAYMSPEQVTGQPLDRRTDVFSMGVVLYEMLTGSRLFAGDSEKDVIANVRDAVVEPPRARNPDIPVDLERVLMKMLAASPEGRYPTAADAAKALTATSAYSPSEGIALGEHLARLFPPSEKRSTVPARPAPEIGRCASPSPPGMPRATGAPVTPPRPLASPDAIATMIGEAPATPAPAWSAPPPSPRPAPGPLSDERTFILDRAAAGGSPSRGVPARAASVNEEQTVILDGGLVASSARAGAPVAPSEEQTRIIDSRSGASSTGGRRDGASGGHARSAMAAQKTAMLDAAGAPASGPSASTRALPQAAAGGDRSRVRWVLGPAIMIGCAAATVAVTGRLLPVETRRPATIANPAAPTAEGPPKPLGRIEVRTTPPGASLVLDGKPHPRLTPTVIEAPIDATVHALIALPGYRPVEQDLLFAAGQRSLSLTLDKLPEAAPPPRKEHREHHERREAPAEPGTISVFVKPSATVRIDGEDIGRTPKAGIELSPGRHTIELLNEELHRRERVQVTIQPGENPEVRRDFTRPEP